MDKFVTVMLYFLWTLSLIGILVVVFTSFQYSDLNIIILIIIIFTLANTYFSLKQKR